MTDWGAGDGLRPLWPPARIRLATARLELRLPDEDELARLARVAAGGVHAPGAQPFGIPWGSQEPDLRARSVLQWHWATRGTWHPQRWTLDFTVYRDDGVQVTDRDGTRVPALRFRLTAAPSPATWPVTVTGVDAGLLAMCGATDPAGHQALPLGGYPHD